MKSTTENKRFVVKEVIKYGLLFGYVVRDTKENKNLPFDFDEDELHKAEAKADLKNALNED